MIRLFDIQNGQVTASEHCYTLKFLKNIMTEYPLEYLKVYTYLFYMTCPNPDINPFFHFPESEKEEVILEEVDGDFSPEDDAILYALQRCKQMYETETSRAYYGIKTALDNLGKVLGILRIAERFDSVRQSYKGVYKDLMDEQQSSVRGGQDLAYDQ